MQQINKKTEYLVRFRKIDGRTEADCSSLLGGEGRLLVCEVQEEENGPVSYVATYQPLLGGREAEGWFRMEVDYMGTDDGCIRILDGYGLYVFQILAGQEELEYRDIEACGLDIHRISSNTGHSENKVMRVKNWLFHDVHDRDWSETSRLPLPMEILEAWKRLSEGEFTDTDNLLIEQVDSTCKFLFMDVPERFAWERAEKEFHWMEKSGAEAPRRWFTGGEDEQ